MQVNLSGASSLWHVDSCWHGLESHGLLGAPGKKKINKMKISDKKSLNFKTRIFMQWFLRKIFTFFKRLVILLKTKNIKPSGWSVLLIRMHCFPEYVQVSQWSCIEHLHWHNYKQWSVEKTPDNKQWANMKPLVLFPVQNRWGNVRTYNRRESSPQNGVSSLTISFICCYFFQFWFWILLTLIILNTIITHA